MNRRFIIGFTGTMRAGKSTAALHLVRHYGCQLIGFKDALDDELLERFPGLLNSILPFYGYRDIYELIKAKPTPPIMRALKQNYGSDVRRADDPDYWVKRWTAGVDKFPNSNIVVDDVRFINEANAIHALGGSVVRIIRPGEESASNHISETEQRLIPVNVHLNNGGTIDDLYANLDVYMKGFTDDATGS